MPFGMLLTFFTLQASSPSIDGSWRNAKGSVIVAVAPCGDATCGRVEWASEKAQADARKGGTDPLVGVEVLSGLKPDGKGRWKGRLFIPDLDKRANAELRMVAPDRLQVRGCAVGRIACKTEIWTRANRPLAGR